MNALARMGVVVAWLAVGVVARADEHSVARQVLKTKQDAIVSIDATLKIDLSSAGRSTRLRDSEQEIHIQGAIVHPSGLVVTSHTKLNPVSLLADMLSSSGEESPLAQHSSFTQIKIRLGDGAEIPYRQVLQDADLDLAFLAPKADADPPARVFPSIDFSKCDPVNVADAVIILCRFGRALDYTATVGFSQVIAQIEKPRLLYAVQGGYTEIGVPAFSVKGNPVGMAVLKRPPPGSMARRRAGDAATVVLPGKDVMKVVQQALEMAQKAESAETRN